MNQETILVVDDNRTNLKVLRDLILSEGYDTLFAMNGVDAIAIAEEKRPDLILLDVMMPDIDGYETCKRLKNNPLTDTIPIIFLTALDDAESKVRAFEWGGTDYVSKPFNNNELLSRIKVRLKVRSQGLQLKDANRKLEAEVAARTEELAKANLELSKLDKAKSDFLALISHELRTPINGMQLLKYIDESDIPDKYKEYITCSKDCLDRLTYLSETALTLTSITSRKVDATLTPVLLNNIIEASIAKAHESSSNISYDSISEPMEIFGDVDMMENCIFEVLDNAVRYAKDSIRISVEDIGDFYEVTVLDDGEGFSKDSISHLFDSFYCREVMKHQQGLGLGLVVAKHIIDAYSGKIIVDTDCPSGGCVKLLFFKL